MDRNKPAMPVPTSDFAAHITQVEEYVAGGDPFSQIIAALEARIKKHGFVSLAPVEQGYYALADFMGATTQGLLDYYLQNADAHMHKALRDALVAIDEAALVEDYDRLVAGGPQPEAASDEGYDDRDAEFVHRQFDIEAKMDDWAERHGLTPASARRSSAN